MTGSNQPRAIGPASAVLLTMGAMIGSGIFVIPHDVAQQTHSMALTLGLWTMGGLVSLLGALSFAELGAALPRNGGLYGYLHRAYGPGAGFLFGWSFLAVMLPASAGFFAHVTAQYGLALFGISDAFTVPVAVAIVVFVVGINIRGLGAALGLQNAATAIKVAGLFAVGFAGLMFGRSHVQTEPTASSGGVTGLLAILIPILWAYDGWINITYVAGEVRNPKRNLPRALVLGSLGVIACYLVANYAYLSLLGGAGVESSSTPAANAAAAALGPAGRTALSLLVGVSTLGGCTVILLTGSRSIAAVAEDGLLFRTLAHRSRSGAPDRALLVIGVLAIAFLVSPLGRLGEVFVVGLLPFYVAGAVATCVLRRREPGLSRPYQTLLYPLPIVAYVAITVAVLGSYAIAEPVRTAASFALIAAGWPLHAFARRRARNIEGRSGARSLREDPR